MRILQKFIVFLVFIIASQLPLAANQPCNSILTKGNCQLKKPIEHQWLFGIGRNNTLDTYLSPYEYVGPELNIRHRSERMARWGKGHVSTVGSFSANGSRLSRPNGDGLAWNGNIFAELAFLYNWHPIRNFRVAIGPMAELGIGGTYLVRTGNNPAQGRISLNVGASSLAEYAFRLRKQQLSARVLLDIPMAGICFSPRYGQSYYEIFGLGHTDKNVCFTHPFNAPSARLSATLQFPLWGATISAGYLGEAHQSKLSGLKYHSWTNAFVIGFVRQIKIL